MFFQVEGGQPRALRLCRSWGLIKFQLLFSDLRPRLRRTKKKRRTLRVSMHRLRIDKSVLCA